MYTLRTYLNTIKNIENDDCSKSNGCSKIILRHCVVEYVIIRDNFQGNILVFNGQHPTSLHANPLPLILFSDVVDVESAFM